MNCTKTVKLCLCFCTLLFVNVLAQIDSYSISDIAAWNHPAKKVFEKYRVQINNVELLKNKTYPIFTVTFPKKLTVQSLSDFQNIAKEIAAANAFWDFKCIDRAKKITLEITCSKAKKKIKEAQLFSNDELFYQGCGNYDTQTPDGTIKPTEIPSQYIDFLRSSETSPYHDILFYGKRDLDMDGIAEVVIASGKADDEGLHYTELDHICIFRDSNGKLALLGTINSGGYAPYKVEFVKMQGHTQTFVLCGVTNGTMRGFDVLKVTQQSLTTFCSSQSPSGVGDDYLIDSNNDGFYDGYVMNRGSYDVLYFQVSWQYRLKSGNFELEATNVELPHYPDNIKDVVTQYLALRVLQFEKAPETETRLKELCIFPLANTVQFSQDLKTIVFNIIQDLTEDITFEIQQKNNSADVFIENKGDTREPFNYKFHLTNNRRWQIDEITQYK